MDTIQAFMLVEKNRGKEQRVFDWDKAAKIIHDKQPMVADAGLREDWEWTNGEIYEHGRVVKCDYTYLASTWATPVLVLYYDDEELFERVEIECWVMEGETEYNAETKWPKSALKILKEG